MVMVQIGKRYLRDHSRPQADEDRLVPHVGSEAPDTRRKDSVAESDPLLCSWRHDVGIK